MIQFVVMALRRTFIVQFCSPITPPADRTRILFNVLQLNWLRI